MHQLGSRLGRHGFQQGLHSVVVAVVAAFAGVVAIVELLRLTVAGDDSGRSSIHNSCGIVQLMLLLLKLLWLLLSLSQTRSYATRRSNSAPLHRLMLINSGIVGIDLATVLLSRTFILIEFVVGVNVLIAEDIIMDVILLRRLGDQHEGLHRLTIVGQVAGHLDNHAIAEGSRESTWLILA